MLRMVFDFEDLNDYKEIESSSVVVPLKVLKLQGLPKLENVWSSHYQGNVSFPSLMSVDVYDCESLTSIFPASFIVKDMLSNLEELRIWRCGINVIVANDQASESANSVFKISGLTSLELHRLQKLRNFYLRGHMLEWPNLKRLSIKDCGELEIFGKEASGSLEIHMEESTLNSSYPLSSHDQVLLPELEILELHIVNDMIPFIWDVQLSHNSLSNLKKFIVKECGFVKLVPLHVLKSLNNLEELLIQNCAMLRMVFDFEDLNDYEEIEPSSVVVPLKKLKLRSLPKLENVWSSHYQGNVSFPSLMRVDVSYCESLTSIFPASFIVKDMLSNLEELRIHECGIKVVVANDQASEYANSVFKFSELTSLELCNLKKLRNFYLKGHMLEWPNLKRLSIEGCGELEICEKEASGSLEIHMEESTLNSSYPLSSRDQVLLPELEILESHDVNDMIPFIWDIQLSHNSLSKLKKFIVRRCGFVKLLPLHVLKSLKNLEELYIQQCRMLKIVFDFEDLNDYKEIEPSSVVVLLKMLKLETLPKLENVWSSHYQGNVSFQSLRSVDVSFCESLTSIFPPSSFPNLRSVYVFSCESLTSIFPRSFIVKGMLHNLEKLKISCCDIDVIVANDQASESATAAFKFPSLTSLQLCRLQKLRYFYPKRHTLECPNLQRLSIEDCDKLEIFEKEESGSLEIHMEESTLNSSYPLLSRNQVIHNLGELTLKGKHAEMIGSGLFPMYRFPSVKMLALTIKKATISYKSLCESFPNLEKLQLDGDFEVSRETNVIAASFSTLTLYKISNMRSLSPSLVSSQNLTHLRMECCYELTTLMTSSTAQCLVHLTRLSIHTCNKMEEIVTKQEGENDEDKEIIFSKLKVLEFDYMPKLKRFCGYNYTFRFPLLEQIVMKACPTFKIFSTGLIDTPSLKSIKLSKDLGEECHEIWDSNLDKTFYHQRFVASRQVVLDKCDASMIRNDRFPVESCPQVEILGIEGFVDDEWLTLLERFPGLKELHVKDCPFEDIFPSYAPSLASFHNLTDLKVSKCHQLLYLVTNSTVKSLMNLETLEISDCEKMEEIVKKESSEDVESGGIIFNGLKILKLESLPRLKTQDFNIEDRAIGLGLRLIFKHNQVVLPKLEILELSKLLNNSIPLIWGGQLLHNSFSNLKMLIVQSCGSLKLVPIHVLKSLNKLEKLQVSKCHMLEMVFGFEDWNDSKEMKSSLVVVPLNLTHLEVELCQGLTTLMTSSAARSLVHLTHLSISCCDQIKEIITKQEGEDEEDMEIVFGKLKYLELCWLRRLKRFCGHSYTISFSSLEHTTIRGCFQLTMFCLRATHAPLLKKIQVGDLLEPLRDIWMTDLNDTIQHQFSIKEVVSTTESMALNAENITMIKDVFPKVRDLYVDGFIDEGVTFPYSSLEIFPKLDSLYVEHCSFEEIFPSHDHITNDFMEEIPPFEHLCIVSLDKLKSIWKDDSQLPPLHQNLTSLKVESCCNLLKLAPSSASFQYLCVIKVSGCHQLIHLVTSSTAKSLVSLEWLEINDCKNMEQIVMNETNENVEGGIKFNLLSQIKLNDMPNLKTFSSHSHTFQFPKLKELKITRCLTMKMFCRGVLKTPKLSKVKIEEHDISWKDEEDLNEKLQILSLAKDSVIEG